MEIDHTPAPNLSLPALDDVLRQFAGRAFLDIELKVAGLESLTLEHLRKYPPLKGFVVSSFLPEVLAAIRDLDPVIPLGFLCETAHQLLRWREMSTAWVIPHVELVDRGLIDAVHAAGRKIMAWTVNRPDNMRQLAVWGVDAIISDETELLIRTLA